MALRFIYGTATQGAADAFVASQITTALSGSSGIAYRVRELVLELSSPSIVVGGNADLQVALSRRTKTAMPLISDPDVILKQSFTHRLTTSGRWVIDLIKRFTYSEDDELLIVEDPLYLCLDSDGTSAVQVCSCRIGYEQVRISDVDRLTLLTQSLV